MRENPFTYGNPISDPRRFFGREREVEQVFTRLRNTEFESSSITGDRRIGKTSLLNYLAYSQGRRAHGIDPATYTFVYVDLQMVDSEMTPPRLWRRLLDQLAHESSHIAIRERLTNPSVLTSLDTFALDELFELVDQCGQHVVFLLDEFEHVTKNQNFGPDFFYGLRSLAIRHKLALVTASRRELNELCHSEEIRSSPFFNIFANIDLSLLSERDARELVARSLSTTGIAFTEEEQALLLDTAGCHPFFLQMASHFLFEAYSRDLDAVGRREFFLNNFQEQATPHLEFYWGSATDAEKIALSVAASLHDSSDDRRRRLWTRELDKVYQRSEPAFRDLERRGLLVGDGDVPALFSPMFADWVLSEVRAGPREQQSFQEWLTSHENGMRRLPERAKAQLRELLSQINPQYRDVFIALGTNPRVVEAVVELLKSAL